MPPRPFPLSLNIGSDICHTARFEKYFTRHHPIGENSGLFRLFDKVLLPSEQRLFWKRFPLVSRVDFERVNGHAQKEVEEGKVRKEGVEEGKEGVTEKRKRIKGPAGWDEERRKACVNFIGGRWAAKEAIIKAYSPTRRLLLRDIEIRQDSSTRTPYGIVLDTPPPPPSSRKDLSSAKSIYTQILEQQILDSQSTLSIESPRRRQQRPSPPILSEDGILDLDAVKNALNPSIPSSSTSTTPPTTTLVKKHPVHDTKAQQAADGEMERKSDEARDAIGLDSVEGQVVKLSISHDGEYCVATALAAV